MNVKVNHPLLEADCARYLKGFYPYEDIQLVQDEQSGYRIHMLNDYLKVAFFDVQNRQILSVAIKYPSINHKSSRQAINKLKTELKGLIHDVGTQITGQTIPWGVLTGIRPTKLGFSLLKTYKDPNKVIEVLTRDYRVAHEKASMLMDIVHREAPYLEATKGGHSVYIGIPFCPSRCSYCTFTSYSADLEKEAFLTYVDSLLKELEAGKHWLKDCHSLYIGGGTPTSLTDEDFTKLIQMVRVYLGDRDIEFTVEAGRPDTINLTKLSAMKAYGVNRISINPQSMNEATLERIGRSHSVQEIYDCFKMARAMGFNHINMDMILGLPSEDVSSVHQTIDALTQLDPESITVHTLAFKRGSKLNEHRIEHLKQSSQLVESMLDLVMKVLTGKDYKPYYLYRQKNMVGNFENVGYCKEGKESIYNIQIMEENESIVAFGAGAISKRVMDNQIVRLDQPKDVNRYRQQLDDIIQKKKEFFVS